MPDREKVIKGLQAHADGCGYRSHHCDAMECPYRYGDESCDIEEMCHDALAMLKEQEERLRKFQKDKDKLCLEVSEWKHKFHDRQIKEQDGIIPYIDIDEAKCPVCKVKLTRQELIGDNVLYEDFFDYCPHCGKPVLWEGR